jgi:nucleoside-diphosphate-sugar epimerase
MAKELILVTGSCGRIGTQIVHALGQRYSIVGFELKNAIYASDAEELVPIDLSSDVSVHQAFQHIRQFYGSRIASVIHLAAYYSFTEEHSEKYETVTVKGTERLVRALADFEVEQFLFTSTMLVHAPTQPGCPITEESCLCPKWDYPLSKMRTEELIHRLRGSIPTVILRIAGVYDDECHSIPMSRQIQRIDQNSLESRFFAGDVTHGASFVHMEDLVDAIMRAVEQRKSLPPELTLLIGEPKTLSYDQLQRMITRLLGRKEFRTFMIPKWLAKLGAWGQNLFADRFIKPWMIDLADDHYELNIDRARQVLGWMPKHTLEETLPKIIADFKSDPAVWAKKNGLTRAR